MRIRTEKLLEEDLEFSDKFKDFELEYETDFKNEEINDLIKVCIKKIKQKNGEDI